MCRLSARRPRPISSGGPATAERSSFRSSISRPLHCALVKASVSMELASVLVCGVTATTYPLQDGAALERAAFAVPERIHPRIHRLAHLQLVGPHIRQQLRLDRGN